MKHTLQSQRGETIVEVLVSFLLLMIFMSMFVVSLRYARAMSQRPTLAAGSLAAGDSLCLLRQAVPGQ